MKSKVIPLGGWKRTVSDIVIIAAAAAVRAAGTYVFISPNHFAVGGISGLAVMLDYIFRVFLNFKFLELGIINLVLNLPFLLLAYLFLNRRFFSYTTIFVVLYSLIMKLMGIINEFVPVQYVDTQPALLGAIIGGALGGISLSMMVRIGGSNGGTDITAAILQKKRPDIGLSWLIFLFDSIIITASFFVYKSVYESNPILPILLALISTFAASYVADYILKGTKSAIKVEIVTNRAEEICADIINVLGHTATVMDATGMYMREGRKLINCVIRRGQLGDLQHILKKYPDTFSYIMTAREIYGKW